MSGSRTWRSKNSNSITSTSRVQSNKLIPAVAKNLFNWTIFLCAISRLLDTPHPLVVHAFNDYWTWRTRHTTTSLQPIGARPIGARHGVLKRTCNSLTTKSMFYPELLHPCRNKTNNSELHRGKSPIPITTRSAACKSLLINYESTISDETSHVETLAQIDTSLPQKIINDRKNGFNGVNTHSKLELISVNGEQSDDTQQKQQQQQQHDEIASDDIPTPTANGGYSHTSISRAKISAANKGKVPWNKGQSRSEEVKARISEGVLRRNRERFLAQLAKDGITEEQYNEQKKAERRRKDAERRARRTAKGGYIPTEETKQRISNVLKERYASGEMKRAPRDPSTIRRGFTHTEETKAKIRESLKRKWAEDTEYRELMTNKTVASGNVESSVRKRIAETLKKRWEDPEFRTKMMTSFANRKSDTSRSKQQSHRQRISAAIKQKWMDEEYRKRATEGMAKVRKSTTDTSNVIKAVMPIQPRIAKERQSVDVSESDVRGGGFVQPLEPLVPIEKLSPLISQPISPLKGDVIENKTKPTPKKVGGGSTKRTGKSSIDKTSVGSIKIEAVKPLTTPILTFLETEKSSQRKDPEIEQPKKRVEEEQEHELHADGCISRMREERRDLYDLLYGDEDEDEEEDHRHHHPSIKMGKGGSNGSSISSSRASVNGESNLFSSSIIAGVSSNTVAALFADDDDLDDFDPYGLHDTSPSPR